MGSELNRREVSSRLDRGAEPAPEPAERPVRTIRVKIARATIVTVVLLAAVAALISQLVPVVMVLVAALMLVGTLNPAVEWLEGIGCKRLAAIGIIFVTMMVVLAGLAVFSVPPFVAQVVSLVQQEPVLRVRLAKFLASYPLTQSLSEGLRQFQFSLFFKSYGAEAITFSKGLLAIVAYGAGSFFLALYIMIDRDRLRGALFAVVPRVHHIKLSRIMLSLETIVGGYVRGQVITCALMAVFLFVLLTACSVPNALAIAAFGGVVDILPFIGIFLTMVPAVLAAIGVSNVAATVVFVLLLCYEEFESRLLIPIVYGRSLRLPSSIVLFSLIAGGSLYGIGGALLALPVAATILMLVDELKVDLPGESVLAADELIAQDDLVGEAEYLRRTDNMTAKEAAGIALEISEEKKQQEEAATRAAAENEATAARAAAENEAATTQPEQAAPKSNPGV